MILQIAPDAPLIVRAAATTALILHIGGGATAIAAGWTSILARKGGRLHRVAGTVFFVAMLSMAGVGAIVAPMLTEAQWTNTSAAIFTLYLVITAWMTVRRPAGEVAWFEKAALAVPAGFVLLVLGLAATGRGGVGFAAVYVFAALGTLAGICDLRMIRAGGIAGPARIARHLWRMTLGLAVATGSFFVGQPRFVPEVLKDTGLNVLISVAVPVLLAFWMFRVRAPRIFRRRRVSAAA
jgi:uncharacterized membrane protein